MEVPMPARFALSTMTAAILCSSLPAQAQPAQQDFPDGPGKATFVAQCGGCHDINRIRAGYTPEGWRTVVRMMQNLEVPVPQDQWPVVTDYLAKNFPEKQKPAGLVIPGPAEVSIKEWPVPTPGSRPHDPLATADGAIW